MTSWEFGDTALRPLAELIRYPSYQMVIGTGYVDRTLTADEIRNVVATGADEMQIAGAIEEVQSLTHKARVGEAEGGVCDG